MVHIKNFVFVVLAIQVMFTFWNCKKTVHTLCIICTVSYVKKKLKARIGDDQTLKVSFTVKVGLLKIVRAKIKS